MGANTPPAAHEADEMRRGLEQRLRESVATCDFRFLYQPVVSLPGGKMISAECLVSWTDAECGEVSPGELMKLAQESGCIVELGDRMLREVCRARRAWRDRGLDVPRIAINMTAEQLDQRSCVDKLLQRLGEFGVAPREIEIELAETGLFRRGDIGRQTLAQLRNAGISIGLDNFGVGSSSLLQLRELPISRLKIDRSFTAACSRDARTLTIVKAVIEMARSLGIAVTAAGIETKEAQIWMEHLGCDAGQGSLFAPPMPAEDFLDFYLDRRGNARAGPSLLRPVGVTSFEGVAVAPPVPPPAVAGALGDTLRGRVTGRRILVADDSPVVQAMFSMLLEEAGLRVVRASNGAEAVELALGQPFDLVLMDVTMPVMDGVEATRRIRAALGRVPPIIGLSANALQGGRENLLAAGMDEVLSSPYAPTELFAALRRWLPPEPDEQGSR